MRACFTTCCMSTAGLHSADYALTRRPPDSPSHGGNVYKRHSSLDSVSFLKSDMIWKIATRSPRRNNTVTQFSAINSLYFCAIAEKPRDVWTVSCSWSVVFAFFLRSGSNTFVRHGVRPVCLATVYRTLSASHLAILLL